MKLRLVSNGTAQGTHVYDESGLEVQNIRGISFDLHADRPQAKITLEVTDLDLEVNFDSDRAAITKAPRFTESESTPLFGDEFPEFGRPVITTVTKGSVSIDQEDIVRSEETYPCK